MLLLEWDHWHARMSAFEAEEQLSAYTVAVMANPKWEIDREGLLTSWRDLIARRRALPGVGNGGFSDRAPGAVRRGARRVAGWVRSHMTGVAVTDEVAQ